MVEIKVKISLIEAISSVHKFDIIALSETYLNDTVPSNEIKIGYSSDIFRSDHPTYMKRMVCVYTIRILYRLNYVQTCIYLMNQLLSN